VSWRCHGFDLEYGEECPSCEQINSREREDRAAQLAATEDQTDAIERSRYTPDVGDFICKECMYRTLRRGATLCFQCGARVPDGFWEEIARQEWEAAQAAQERAESARAAREAAAAADTVAVAAQTRQTEGVSCLMVAAGLVLLVFIVLAGVLTWDWGSHSSPHAADVAYERAPVPPQNSAAVSEMIDPRGTRGWTVPPLLLRMADQCLAYKCEEYDFLILRTTSLYLQPDTGSRVVDSVTAGTILRSQRTAVVTQRPWIYVITSEQISAQNPSYRFTPGEMLYVYHKGEEYCSTMWTRGVLYGYPDGALQAQPRRQITLENGYHCVMFPAAGFKEVRAGQSESWVETTSASGVPGWVRSDSLTLEYVEEEVADSTTMHTTEHEPRVECGRNCRGTRKRFARFATGSGSFSTSSQWLSARHALRAASRQPTTRPDVACLPALLSMRTSTARLDSLRR